MIDKKILIFRGEFDPIHVGHTNTVRYITKLVETNHKNLGKYDELWILPVYKYGGFKSYSKRDLTDGLHRINMLHMAFRDALFDTKKLKICTIELDTKNTSGFYKTIQSLRKYYPTYSFGIIMGMDCAKQIRCFRHSRRLVNENQCIVIARCGYKLMSRDRYYKWFISAPHIYLGVNPTSHSVASTRIRGLIAAGNKIHHDLPRGVQDYINDNRLYSNLLSPSEWL